MEINQQLEQPEEKHTKESALFFLNNKSEKNKMTAFLRYYRDEDNTRIQGCLRDCKKFCVN